MAGASCEAVREFWQGRAGAAVHASEVTHRDVWQRWLEIETIGRFVRPTDRVLDVGCGNGYTTRRLARLAREAVGVDYSDEMIRRAQAESDGAGTFAVKDVRHLGPGDFGLFDVVVSARCLINLDGWPAQRRALANIASVLRPGGRLVFVEGCRQGRQRLDALRVAVGLPAMPAVWHNVDFDEAATLAFLGEAFELEERVNLGLYDLVSRVVHPLLVAPEPPRYDARLNEVAARLALVAEGFGELSRLLFLVLRRKGAR